MLVVHPPGHDIHCHLVQRDRRPAKYIRGLCGKEDALVWERVDESDSRRLVVVRIFASCPVFGGEGAFEIF